MCSVKMRSKQNPKPQLTAAAEIGQSLQTVLVDKINGLYGIFVGRNKNKLKQATAKKDVAGNSQNTESGNSNKHA